jgi:L-histidine Nalpha-methyltransferase
MSKLTCKLLPARPKEIVAGLVLTSPGPCACSSWGAGTATETCILLDAITCERNEVVYIPVDVSPDALDEGCDSIGCLFPDVQLQPMVANYVTHPPKLERFKGTALALYIGSSIGNFSPE